MLRERERERESACEKEKERENGNSLGKVGVRTRDAFSSHHHLFARDGFSQIATKPSIRKKLKLNFLEFFFSLFFVLKKKYVFFCRRLKSDENHLT